MTVVTVSIGAADFTDCENPVDQRGITFDLPDLQALAAWLNTWTHPTADKTNAGGYWVPGAPRQAGAAAPWSALVLDYDRRVPPPELALYDRVTYPTRTDSDATPRSRVIVGATRPVVPDEVQRLIRWFGSDTGAGGNARLFWGRHPTRGCAQYVPGLDGVLNPDTLLSTLPPAPPPAADDDWSDEPVPGHGITDDAELIAHGRAMRSARSAFGVAASFADLWDGNADVLGRVFPPNSPGQAYDASAADLALSSWLAWLSGGNCEQIARLLRASGLRRPKHDREDYVRSTVLRACAGMTSWYSERPAPGEPMPTNAADSDFAFDPDDPMPNARLFVATEFEHPERPLLLNQGGAFYAWDGTCWPELDHDELRARLYEFFERKTYAASKGPAPFQPNRNKVANLVESLRAITLLSARTAAPSWLRPNALPADELISCENGLIHWPTRALYAHSPDYFVHHSVPFAFDPGAPPPTRWHSFLAELWPDDPESIECLQEWFGYLISGDTSLQKMLLLYGSRRSGKGTIARVLTALLGAHNVAGPTLASFGERFGLMALIGKPVAIVSDARLSGDASKISTTVERLLSISGEDALTSDRKHKDHWTGKLPTRIVVISNELPRFNDASGALPSRFEVLRLRQSFYGRENPNLTTELLTELPGIFNWALNGLARLRARGRFVQPTANAEAVAAFEDLSSPAGAFVRDRCETGTGLAVKCSALYIAYKLWCAEHGHRPTSDAVFGRDLRAVSASIDRTRPRAPDGGRAWVYAGVALAGPGSVPVGS